MRVKKLFYPHIIAHFLLIVNKKTSFFYPNAIFFVLYKNERLQLCIFLENDGTRCIMLKILLKCLTKNVKI